MLVEQAAEHWQYVAPLVCKPRTEADYDRLVAALDELLDLTGDDEAHPLNSLVDIIGDWIEAYDEERRPMPQVGGVSMLAGRALWHLGRSVHLRARLRKNN